MGTMRETHACRVQCLRTVLLMLLEFIAAGDLQRDLTAFMKECFFKDPTLAAQHSRLRGGKGLFDKQYGVRCSIHHRKHALRNSCHRAQAAHLGCSVARRSDSMRMTLGDLLTAGGAAAAGAAPVPVAGPAAGLRGTSPRRAQRLHAPAVPPEREAEARVLR